MALVFQLALDGVELAVEARLGLKEGLKVLFVAGEEVAALPGLGVLQRGNDDLEQLVDAQALLHALG